MNFDTFPTVLLDLIYDYKYQLEVSDKKEKVIEQLRTGIDNYQIHAHLSYRYCKKCGNYKDYFYNWCNLTYLRSTCNCDFEYSGHTNFRREYYEIIMNVHDTFI